MPVHEITYPNIGGGYFMYFFFTPYFWCAMSMCPLFHWNSDYCFFSSQFLLHIPLQITLCCAYYSLHTHIEIISTCTAIYYNYWYTAHLASSTSSTNMGNSFSNIEFNDSGDNSVLSELGLLLVTLEMMSSHLEEQENLLQSLLLKVTKDYNEERHRQSRTKETPQPSRRTFHEITQRMSEKAFQCTFRMQRKSFYKLCALMASSRSNLFFLNTSRRYAIAQNL
jgi:hypothetical protein